MSLENVQNYLEKLGIANRIQVFDVSSATVELAAQAVHCKPERIAKTLSFLVEEQPILIVTAGDVKIDNSKYKQYFGVKAKMLSADEVEKMIGHQVGGVCPFAIQENVHVYLDISLKRFESIFPACGSSNSAIELTPTELETYSNSHDWIDVCKIPM